MRDKRFVAKHQGGLLEQLQHQQLMEWACCCAEHVRHLLDMGMDSRLDRCLDVATQWKKGNASVGEARQASIDAIRVARGLLDPVAIAVARCVGHAVATAHMADHSTRAAWYALEAVKKAGGSIDEERQWQDKHLSLAIRDLVRSARRSKAKSGDDRCANAQDMRQIANGANLER